MNHEQANPEADGNNGANQADGPTVQLRRAQRRVGPDIPPKPSEAEVNQWLNAVFAPIEPTEEEAAGYKAAMVAFQNLTGYFLHRLLKQTPALVRALKYVRYDRVGLISMLKRFQRDAFGMVKFEMVAQGMVDAGQLSDEVRKRILKEARLLGLRVSSDEPRKTRIAAAFSLWMCVFRPVTFDTERLSELKPEKLETFCAALNFWLAYSYLEKFGWVSLGEGEDARIRLERIKHDFTFREVSTSTLETLYCSIFRLNRSCHCKSGTHVLEVLHHRETNVGFTIALNGEACHRFQSIEEVEACIYSKASWLPEGFIPPTKMEDWQSGRAGNS